MFAVCSSDMINILRVIMVLPHHPTPIPLRTHTADPVPFAICGGAHGADSVLRFDERSAAEGSYGVRIGADLVRLMIGGV